jgi:hypothetical protein
VARAFDLLGPPAPYFAISAALALLGMAIAVSQRRPDRAA